MNTFRTLLAVAAVSTVLSHLPLKAARADDTQTDPVLESLSALASPEEVPGLEATNLQLVGKTAYVVYNTAGNVVHGALEVVDVSDVKKPRRLGLQVFENAEFSDIVIRGGFAFLTGDVNTPTHQGAMLKVIDISRPAQLHEVAQVDLPGYTATSIQFDGNEAILSVGDNAGLNIFDVAKPAAPKLLLRLPFTGALYAGRYSGDYVALSGTPATSLALFNRKGVSVAPALQLSHADTTSPGRFVIKGHYLYTNAGMTGLSVVRLPHWFSPGFKVVSQVALPGNGNGLAVFHDTLFLAQGNAGLHVYDVRHKRAPRDLGALRFQFPGESTNQVKFAYDRHRCWKGCLCGVLFVANGSGGLRIFELSQH